MFKKYLPDRLLRTISQLRKNKYTIPVLASLIFLIGFAVQLTLLRHDDLSLTHAQVANQIALYVNPAGSDSNAGTDSAAPLKTIQAALDKAAPGTTINLAPGVYQEELTTKVDGTATAPIIIKGPETGKDKSGRYQAVLYGSGHSVNINNSYYTLQGFTIDGQQQLAGTTYPASLSAVRTFKDSVQGKTVNDKLIYVGAGDTTHDLTGIVINDMFLNGSGGECVRLRNDANHNEIENSVIQWCGMYPSGDDSSKYKYHNGEGVYIGTSPKSTDQPMYADDASSFNYVHDNTIYTYGSECFEVKENAHDNTLQNNDCRYNDEPSSFTGSNIELRGYNNMIIGNIIMGSRGYGLKMASDSTSYTQGGNSAQNNNFSQIASASILNNQSTAQGLFCGNMFTGTVLSGNSVGNSSAPCPGSTSIPTATPIATITPTIIPTRIPTATSIPQPTATPIPTKIPTPTPLSVDTTSPSVTITAPKNGATVKGNTTVSASATDNVGVTKVVFLINGSTLCTDTTAPYSCNWSVPNAKNKSYTINAQAFDARGNIGTSSIQVSTSK